MKDRNRLMQLASGLLLSGFVVTSALAGDAAPVDKWVYIISPQDGETVSSPVTVRFGLHGMGVAPAGTEKANTGHHHLLVDGKQLPDMAQPMGKGVMHFGGGQTETTLELAPGSHTLQLILGDKNHQPHHPPLVSDQISIEVK